MACFCWHLFSSFVLSSEFSLFLCLSQGPGSLGIGVGISAMDEANQARPMTKHYDIIITNKI